jgi:hypothetical protein
VGLVPYPEVRGDPSTGKKVFRVKQQLDVRVSPDQVFCQPKLDSEDISNSDVSVAIVDVTNPGRVRSGPSCV